MGTQPSKDRPTSNVCVCVCVCVCVVITSSEGIWHNPEGLQTPRYRKKKGNGKVI